jgi:hypothetical protein
MTITIRLRIPDTFRKYGDRDPRRHRHGVHQGLIHLPGGGTAVGGSSGSTIQLLDAIDGKIIDGAGKIVSAKCRLQ